MSFSITIDSNIPTVISIFNNNGYGGIGLTVNLKQFKSAGIKPILLGLITWLIVIITSIITMKLINLM